MKSQASQHAETCPDDGVINLPQSAHSTIFDPIIVQDEPRPLEVHGILHGMLSRASAAGARLCCIHEPELVCLKDFQGWDDTRGFVIRDGQHIPAARSLILARARRIQSPTLREPGGSFGNSKIKDGNCLSTIYPRQGVPRGIAESVTPAITFRALLAIGSLNATAISCTVCDSEVGREVRNGVFNEGFGATLLAVVAPFPLLFVAVWIVHRWARRVDPSDKLSSP